MIKFLKKFLALINTLEGVIHLIVAFISFWGIFSSHILDWRVWTAPVENLIFGLLSILTGYILGKEWHHHHGHIHIDDKEK